MKKLLIPYLTAGFPEKEWFPSLLKTLDENGADFIEIGIPFSDPIADGPTIQAASQRALDNGVTTRWVVSQIKAMRAEIRAELIFFSYFNPLASLAANLGEAAAILADAGFHGVLVPDLALEQADELIQALKKHGLHYIPLIAPTTSEQRIARIAPFTTSFAYGVSVTGVTGARQGVALGLDQYMARVRRHLKQFVVGFGIASAEDAARISKMADGVVIGSAIIRKLADAKDKEDAVKTVAEFLSGVRQAIDR